MPYANGIPRIDVGRLSGDGEERYDSRQPHERALNTCAAPTSRKIKTRPTGLALRLPKCARRTCIRATERSCRCGNQASDKSVWATHRSGDTGNRPAFLGLT